MGMGQPLSGNSRIHAFKALTSNKISSRVLKWLVGYRGSKFDGWIFYFLDLPKKRILMREFLCPQSQSPPAPNQPLPQPASLVEQLHRVYLQIFAYILTNRIQVWIGVPAVSIVL